MSFKGLLEEIKEEWQFYKRHPEMLLVLLSVIGSLIYLLLKEVLINQHFWEVV